VAYGGTERVVHLLTEGLVREGLDVTLFATGDSRTGAHLAYRFEDAPSDRIGNTMCELAHVLPACERAAEFDVVHDHSGPLGLALLAAQPATVLHTAHGPINPLVGEIYERACRGRAAGLTSLSLSQRRPRPDLPWLATVPNAIDVAGYPPRPSGSTGDYLLFLGRMCAEKGAHRAIEVARAAGLPLKIAAKCREPAERQYFERFVEPHLGDGVEYVGEASRPDKIELLHGALATLAPIEWEEPFGLVLVEAAACGTPVIATGRGAVPEVVVDGVTGVVVSSHHEMPAAVEQAVSLDREAMRAAVERRYDARVMVERYLEVYELAVRRSPRRRSQNGRARAARSALAGQVRPARPVAGTAVDQKTPR
jgi:glycosyltransferase involved in cell wall biosynthesis